MQKVGHVPEVVRGRSKLTRNELANIDTFRNAPEGQESFPTFSAPIGPRAILAEVRAPPPPRTMLASTLDEDVADFTPTLASATLKPIAAPAKKSTGGTMSKGGVIAQVDQLAWLASVKVGNKRGSHSSETRSRARSSANPRTRPPSWLERSGSSIGARQRSGSLSRAFDNERRDGDEGQSLQDEFVYKLPFSLAFLLMFSRITTVLTKLSASKITLEKVRLSLLS